MDFEALHVKQIFGNVDLIDSSGTHKELTSNENFSLHSTITPLDENSFALVHIEGVGDLKVTQDETLFLDETLLQKEGFVDESGISTSSLTQILEMGTAENVLNDNELLDFSSIHTEPQIDSYKGDLDIRDLIDAPTIETKILYEDTPTIALNQTEWNKHEGQIFEDGHLFDLYSKPNGADEVFTLLIQDTISVIDTQG